MTEHLFLRLGQAPDRTEAVILTADGRQARAPVQISVTGAASLAEGRRINVLVPSDRAVVLAAQIPKASSARMRSLLPYSLEDHFATEIDDLHFAAGAPLDDGRISATVVEKSQIESWLDSLAEAHIRPHAMYADCDGVPLIPSTLVLVAEGETVLGRRPGQPPFRLEALSLDEIWTLLDSDDAGATDLKHVLIYGTGPILSARTAEIDALREKVSDVDVRELRDSSTSVLAATLIAGSGTNLLQGKYALRSNLRVALKPWYAAAGLAAALTAVSILGAGIELLKLSRADDSLAQQTGSICADRFGVSLVSACRAEVQRRLASAGQSAASSQESFLSALNAVADSDGPDQIEALSYRSRTLDLDILVRDVAALDRFSQQVGGTQRFEVRTLSNTPQDEGLRSRVQIVVAP